MIDKAIDKQARSIFNLRFPGQQPKKGQIRAIRREILKKNKRIKKKQFRTDMSVKEISRGRTTSVDPEYTPGDPFSYGIKKYKSSTERTTARKAMAENYRKYSTGPVVGAGAGSGGGVKLSSNYRVVNAPPEKKIFIGGVGLVPAHKVPLRDSEKQAELDKRAMKLFQDRFPGKQPLKGQIKELKQEILKERRKLGLN